MNKLLMILLALLVSQSAHAFDQSYDRKVVDSVDHICLNPVNNGGDAAGADPYGRPDASKYAELMRIVGSSPYRNDIGSHKFRLEMMQKYLGWIAADPNAKKVNGYARSQVRPIDVGDGGEAWEIDIFGDGTSAEETGVVMKGWQQVFIKFTQDDVMLFRNGNSLDHTPDKYTCWNYVHVEQEAEALKKFGPKEKNKLD